MSRPHRNSVWLTTLKTDTPYQSVKVDLYDENRLHIGFWRNGPFKNIGDTVTISRKDARLLAKRINQCLDATVKK